MLRIKSDLLTNRNLFDSLRNRDFTKLRGLVLRARSTRAAGATWTLSLLGALSTLRTIGTTGTIGAGRGTS